MVKLVESLKYWGKESFSSILKMEIIKLGTNNLPLQKAATPGRFVLDSGIDVIVLMVSDGGINIKAKIGIMFSEVLWGYCCGEEEPMVSHAYCEIIVIINKRTSSAKFVVLVD